MVQTVAYSYNAALNGRGVILRYDSPHVHHNHLHHVHRYDVLKGDSTGRLEPVDQDEWPTLGEVVEELRVWYYDLRHLKLPRGKMFRIP